MKHLSWPELPYEAWKETYETLHMWIQIVGKIRLACMPWLNHTWQVTLYPSACGLTTGRMPYGDQAFQIDFDFVAHELNVRTSQAEHGVIQLVPMPVSEFYASLMEALTSLKMPVSIYQRPCEVDSPLPFDQDDIHRSYDAEYATRCWRVMCSSADVFGRFRSRYYGKVSPVHLFWGSFDLAVTRFSGRVAPPHPGGIPNLPDRVTRDAYSHEVSSAGFWPGGARAPYPLYYSYAYPEPNGFRDATVEPSSARYDTGLGEYILPYDYVRQASDPEQTLLAFLQSTYVAAADRGGWDRRALEVPAETLHAVDRAPIRSDARMHP